MGRRSRRVHPRSDSRPSGTRHSVATPRRAPAPPVSFWSTWDDEISPPAVVIPPLRPPGALPWLPTSIPQGTKLRLFPRALGDQPKARSYLRLLNVLQGVRTAHRYSTPCEARRTRARVLHALGVAGRRGVGAGKPRRLSKFSHLRCV